MASVRSHRTGATSSAVFIDVPPPSVPEILWDVFSPLIWKISVFYTKIVLVLASIGMFTATAVLLYSFIYWLAVPKQLHTFPIFFDYSTAQIDNTTCANVTLAYPQWNGLARPTRVWDRPEAGFEYDIGLQLSFPRNDHNVRQTPVMISTSVMLSDHEVLASTTRPFLLVHTSWLAALCRDIIWMVVSGLGLMQDSHTADVTLIESFPVMQQETVSFVNVCMNPPVHVYSASLKFVSKLSGLMYIVAHHPILTGLVVISVAVAFAVAAVLGVMLIRSVRPMKEDLVDIDIDEVIVQHESTSSESSFEEFIDGADTHSVGSSEHGIRRRNT